MICGGKGADYIDGGRGKDTLLGQAAGTPLNGGIGKDRCEGGKGNDQHQCEHADRGDYCRTDCEVEKSTEKSRRTPPRFH